MRLLCRGSWVCPHLAGSDQETLLFNTVHPLSCCTVFRGNYCLETKIEKHDPRHQDAGFDQVEPTLLTLPRSLNSRRSTGKPVEFQIIGYLRPIYRDADRARRGVPTGAADYPRLSAGSK